MQANDFYPSWQLIFFFSLSNMINKSRSLLIRISKANMHLWSEFEVIIYHLEYEKPLCSEGEMPNFCTCSYNFFFSIYIWLKKILIIDYTHWKVHCFFWNTDFSSMSQKVFFLIHSLLSILQCENLDTLFSFFSSSLLHKTYLLTIPKRNKNAH